MVITKATSEQDNKPGVCGPPFLKKNVNKILAFNITLKGLAYH